jgi:hypothetical protein
MPKPWVSGDKVASHLGGAKGLPAHWGDKLWENVWKVGSRWSETGQKDRSILDIFRQHNVVFVGTQQKRFSLIRKGDLIAVSDGKKVVALGEAQTGALPITDKNLGVTFNSRETDRFWFHESVLGCRISFMDLDPKDHVHYRIGTFHRVINKAEHYRNLYKEYYQRFKKNNQFEIKARSCTLMPLPERREEVDCLWKEDVHFVVPIYQRPYSWKELEIRKLLVDMYESFMGHNNGALKEPMFIGTIQLSESKLETAFPNRRYHEVVDGQQRLTTILLTLKVLLELMPKNSEQFSGVQLSSWLETRVSGGVQQDYLKKALTEKCDGSDSSTQNPDDPTLNPYDNALRIICATLREFENSESEIMGAEKFNFSFKGFTDYILTRVYFVVIETRATLSKTLQIFNAINTAGMDLNGGDIFKVRFYEYLQRYKNVPESAFEEISGLYRKIDERNRCAERQIGSILEIMSLAQHLLTARYELPVSLHELASGTFFERFFDAALQIDRPDGFSLETIRKVELDIGLFQKLIETRYTWEKVMGELGMESLGNLYLLWNSRYGRYWYMPVLYLHLYPEDRNGLEQLISLLSKLFVIYSVRYAKVVNEIHNFVKRQLKIMCKAPSPKGGPRIVLQEIQKKLSENKEHFQGELDKHPLVNNAKSKNLVCRLSAFLEELPLTESNEEPHALCKRIFHCALDIEHIEPSNNKDGSRRAEIQELWKDELNQIGNLIVLEPGINRSIQNEGYEVVKLPAYKKSKYAVVKKHVAQYPQWNLDACRQRHSEEVGKIIDYLFKDELS